MESQLCELEVRRVVMKLVISTLFSLIVLCASAPVLAGDQHTCELVKKLRAEVVFYGCPTYDEALHDKLLTLADNTRLVRKICASNPSPKLCRRSTLNSLPIVATGLARIMIAKDSEHCRMAVNDKTQFLWYVNLYLQETCEA